MTEAVDQSLDTLIAKETWTLEDRDALLAILFEGPHAPAHLRKILSDLEKANPDATGGAALKIGMVRYMLCRFEDALEILTGATDNRDRRLIQAECYKHMHQYERAREELARARDRGLDSDTVDLDTAETHALEGNGEAAEKILGKLKRSLADDARFLYVQGLVHELCGRSAEAQGAYEQANSIDPGHAGAAFRLAYFHDLHGNEDIALELYQECIDKPPLYASALLNLAVLYEDVGQYDNAIYCLKRILATNPNHARAQLFLKDAEASKTMYYDEDQAKRIAHRNAILDIPVTDFELSVRARNCLKKMSLRCLGDLIRTSEAELMSYKNFGETSLREIKSILAAKGLRLGQALEEEGELVAAGSDPAANVKNEGVLATPIAQIALSKRARKAMETLKIATLGELTAKTEAELLACENFGQTSLNEIRQRLGEYGLALRELE